MVKCDECGKTISAFGGSWIVDDKRVCAECEKEIRLGLKKFKTSVKIKCPFCGNMFTPKHMKKRTRSLGGNILKGVAFLPWGVVSALKTEKTIDVICPHCGMTVQSKPR